MGSLYTFASGPGPLTAGLLGCVNGGARSDAALCTVVGWVADCLPAGWLWPPTRLRGQARCVFQSDPSCGDASQRSSLLFDSEPGQAAISTKVVQRGQWEGSVEV